MEPVNYFILELLNIVIMGLSQGFIDFLPLSADGRLDFLQKLSGKQVTYGENLYVMTLLQLGTLLAIIFVFRKTIWDLLKAAKRLVQKIFTRKLVWKEARSKQKLVVFILVSCIPVCIVLPLMGVIRGVENILWLTGLLFIASGVVFFFSDKIKTCDRSSRKMTAKDAVIIGLANAVALLPGVSSTGLTASVGVFRHFKRSFAPEYAFLLAIPSVFTNAVISLVRAVTTGADITGLPIGLVSMLVSFGTGLVCIKVIKKLIQSKKMFIFAAVSVVVGLGFIIYQFIG